MEELKFSLTLFDDKLTQVNQNGIPANGVSLEAIGPIIRAEIERYPLGKINSVLVFRLEGGDKVYAARYTIQDYLTKNIPKVQPKLVK